MYDKARVILNSFEKGMIMKLLMTKQNIDILYATLIIKSTIKKYMEISSTYLELLNEILKIAKQLESVRQKWKKKKESNGLQTSYADFQLQKISDTQCKEDLTLVMVKVEKLLHTVLMLKEAKQKIKELHFFLHMFLFEFCCDKKMFTDYLQNGVNNIKLINLGGKNNSHLQSCRANGCVLTHLFHKDSLISELYSEGTIKSLISNSLNMDLPYEYKMTGMKFSNAFRFYDVLTIILYYTELDYSLRHKTYDKIRNCVFTDADYVKADEFFLQKNIYISKLRKLCNFFEIS